MRWTLGKDLGEEVIDQLQVLIGDCRETLSGLEPGSVQCCVTSPPYYGLRDYGHDGQIGLEQTPDEYVAEMVKVFQKVKRVLRGDGTLFLNLGDSYAANRGGTTPPAETLAGEMVAWETVIPIGGEKPDIIRAEIRNVMD